jgi:outer membrane autotransporter protein
VEINSSGESTLLDIDGTATLAGTVNITSTDNVINPNVTYDILHADGGITGTFTTVTTTNPVLIPKLTYNAQDVLLNLAANFPAIALTKNQKEVALQLNTITNPTSSEQELLNELISLAGNPATASLAQLALDEMSGQQYTHSLVIADFSSRQFTRRLYDPLRSIITTIPSCCTEACACENSWGLSGWLEAGGGRSFFDGNREARGFKMSGYEITGGIQKTLEECWTVGLAGSYDYENVHYNLNGRSKNYLGFGAIYGLYRPEDFYVWGDVAFGWDQQRLKRFIDVGSLHYEAHSKPKIYQGSAYLEAGVDYLCDCVLIQPFLGFELGYFRRSHIHEHGAHPINLDISAKSHTNVYSNLGVHITTQVTEQEWLEGVSFSLDLAWQCRLTSLDNKVSEHFRLFGDQFTIIGAPFARNSINGALTITKRFCEDWQCFVEASGERWSRASTYNFLGGVIYIW